MGVKGYTDKDINKLVRNEKSVKSIHPCQSVIQKSYVIAKAQPGEINADIRENELTEFVIQLPLWV
jgi:hypothetical protein